MFVTKEENGKWYVLPAQEIGRMASAPLAMRILTHLAKRESYAKEIARALKENEQKIYYHIRCLEKLGMVRLARKEERGGAVAKYYALTKPSFVVRFREFEEARRTPRTHPYLQPFVTDGVLRAKIIVGSPDPHGPERARSRDAYYGIDLGLFLGTFLASAAPSVLLDTEVSRDDLKENLILIGGPVTNRVTKMLNSRLPVRFDKNRNIYSSLSKKTYRQDDAGVILRVRNPVAEGKNVLLLAGKRYSGTKAALLAFIRKFDEVTQMQKKGAHACIVEGIDSDYDGIVDDVKVLE